MYTFSYFYYYYKKMLNKLNIQTSRNSTASLVPCSRCYFECWIGWRFNDGFGLGSSGFEDVGGLRLRGSFSFAIRSTLRRQLPPFGRQIRLVSINHVYQKEVVHYTVCFIDLSKLNLLRISLIWSKSVKQTVQICKFALKDRAFS